MTIKLVGAYIKQIGQENKNLLYHNGSKNAQEKKNPLTIVREKVK